MFSDYPEDDRRDGVQIEQRDINLTGSVVVSFENDPALYIHWLLGNGLFPSQMDSLEIVTYHLQLMIS